MVALLPNLVMGCKVIRCASRRFFIMHGNGIIDIDCGCGHQKTAHRRLACLRLDDMAEFYVGNADTEICLRKT